MKNTNTADAAEFTARHDARHEQKLRELSSDLADAVERGDMTEMEAIAQYERTATRWAFEF